MKEQNASENKPKKAKRFSNEKRFYIWTASGCLAVLAAIIGIVLLVNNLNQVDVPTGGGNSSNSSTQAPTQSSTPGETGGSEGEQNKPAITPPEGMIMPVESVSVCNEFGFYYNKTLNNYYEHIGIDFSASVGTEVLACDKGTVESIYRDDVLMGTELVIDHGNGLKTLYRFIDVKEGLKVGDKVEKGEVIATVAEATGEEYKDGAHLHFEMQKNGETIDPATYLTFEEK